MSNQKKSFSCWRQLFLVALLLIPSSLLNVDQLSAKETTLEQQQGRSISGIVRDEKGEPIVGVFVLEQNVTGNGVMTTNAGTFNITVKDKAILEVSCMGYQTQTINTSGRTFFEIILMEDRKMLDEVVVVGYGKQSRTTLTTSVSSLDSKALENVPYTNAASALQGGIPGLTVQSYNGQPGLAPRIILRGGTSIDSPNGSTPLYIVDGIIRTEMNNIAAQDIQSIEVLKDAAATAIYGSRASNGVVLITTKSGREGPVRITMSYDFSIAEENKGLELVSASDYIVGARQSIMWLAFRDSGILSKLSQATGYGTGNDLTERTAYTTQYLTDANKHKLQEGWGSVQDPYDPSKTIIFKETDFQKLRQRTAYSHNYNVSASGGTDKALYNISLGYMDADGTALNSYYNRLSYSMNGSLKVLDNLRVKGRMLFSNVDNHNIYGDPNTQWTVMLNTFVRSAALPSTTKMTFEDGTIAPGFNSSLGNPLYYQVGPHAQKTKDNSTALTLGIGADWEILPGLTFETLGSLYETNVIHSQFQPSYESSIGNMDTNRNAGAYNSNNKSWQVNGILTYTKKINLHHLEAKVGYEYYKKHYNTMNAYGRGASTDLIPTLNASAEPVSVSGWETDFVSEGVFSRINYDYDEKYILSFNARYDGASSLGANNRTGFFPGISAGWNVHREKFWQNSITEKLIRLKLRASYGVNGNVQGLGEYDAQGRYAVGSEYFGSAAISPSVLPNMDLKWERSKTLDVGMDMGLFDNRISFLVDVYKRITDNLITSVTLPGSSGFSSIKTNYGSLSNKGLELSLEAHIFNPRSPFQWRTLFNFAAVRTRILKLPDNGVERNRQGGQQIYDPVTGEIIWVGGLQEGGRIGDMIGYHFEGVYSTDEEAASAPLDNGIGFSDKRKFGGDAKWTDFDGNGIIDSYDRYVIGNRYPTITGGFHNTFTYKNLSLNIRSDFMLGHTIYNYAKRHLDGQLQGDVMPTKEYYENSWKEQGDNAKYPRYLWQNQNNNLRDSQLYLEKGNFLALREVSLVYLIPNMFAQKMKMSNLRVNITGSNLGYLTAYKGLNPEDGGNDYGRYPNPRTVTFGIRATF